MSETPRGVRNNNPGNIDRDATSWQGMAADQSGDPRFVVFKTPQFGIRALARVLLTYEHQHNLNTLAKIIARWAPPGENDTAAYVADVCARVGASLGRHVGPDDVIDVDQAAVMKPLVCAIIAHENKGYAYPDAVVDEALHMAGVADAPPPPLAKQGAFRAQVATGAAIAASAAAQSAPAVKSAADQLADYTGIGVFAHLHTALLAVAGALVVVGLGAAALKHELAK